MAVHEGSTERALVPIENSLEGGVAATLDALATEASDVRIVAEHIHPIHHCLIARGPLDLDEVTRVISHPQAMSQCGALLRGPLAHAERVIERLDRRGRARRGRVGRAVGRALVAPRRRALRLRRPPRDVEDSGDNETRFVWLAPASARAVERATRPRSCSGASTTSPPARS